MHTAEQTPTPVVTPSSDVHYCDGCGQPTIAAPVLKCKCCGEVLRLRCFVYSAEDQKFRAECIDLDIVAEGNTQKAAITGLQDALRGYMEVAFDGGPTDGLLLRPSPISHRLRYYLQYLTDIVAARLSRSYERHTAECYYSLHQHC
jgi:hypothetical protein